MGASSSIIWAKVCKKKFDSLVGLQMRAKSAIVYSS